MGRYTTNKKMDMKNIFEKERKQIDFTEKKKETKKNDFRKSGTKIRF